VHERLTLYKRLANCEDDDELHRAAGGTGRPLRRNARADPALLETHRLRIAGRPLASPSSTPGRLRSSYSSCPTRRSIRPISSCSSSPTAAFKLAGPDKLLRRASFKGKGLQPQVAGAGWDRLREMAYEDHGG
jgi:transcription-repair coupling factor (superfamily II helicase)